MLDPEMQGYVALFEEPPHLVDLKPVIAAIEPDAANRRAHSVCPEGIDKFAPENFTPRYERPGPGEALHPGGAHDGGGWVGSGVVPETGPAGSDLEGTRPTTGEAFFHLLGNPSRGNLIAERAPVRLLRNSNDPRVEQIERKRLCGKPLPIETTVIILTGARERFIVDTGEELFELQLLLDAGEELLRDALGEEKQRPLKKPNEPHPTRERGADVARGISDGSSRHEAGPLFSRNLRIVINDQAVHERGRIGLGHAQGGVGPFERGIEKVLRFCIGGPRAKLILSHAMRHRSIAEVPRLAGFHAPGREVREAEE